MIASTDESWFPKAPGLWWVQGQALVRPKVTCFF
jgi:hypothetical protein